MTLQERMAKALNELHDADDVIRDARNTIAEQQAKMRLSMATLDACVALMEER